MPDPQAGILGEPDPNLFASNPLNGLDIVERSVTVSTGGPFSLPPGLPAGAMLVASGDYPQLFDTFGTKGTEAVPAKSDSGASIILVNNGVSGSGMSIISGQLTNASTGASTAAGYYELNAGKQITRIGAVITFSAGATTGSAALACWASDLAQSFPTIPDAPIHCSFGPTQFVFGYYQGNTFHQLLTGSYAPCTQDGLTQYRVEIAIDLLHNTVYILQPDGVVKQVTDSHFSSIVGQFPDWEVFQNNPSTETRAAFINLWAANDGPPGLRAYASVGDAMAIASGVPSALWLPINAFTVVTGLTAPTLAAVGGGRREAYSFANAVDAYLGTTFYVPKFWTAIALNLWWVNAGAGTGNVQWGYELHTFAAGVTINAADTDVQATATAGSQDVLTNTLLTGAAAPTTPGSLNFLRIHRVGTSGSDTLANAVGFLGLQVQPA